MRTTLIALSFIFAYPCLAVGWEVVSKEGSENRGISVFASFNEAMSCHRFKVALPELLNFKELGNRTFWSASYQAIKDKRPGWQLKSGGTNIPVSFSVDNQQVSVSSICLSAEDLGNAYLKVRYGGEHGSPPMELLLKLDEFK